MDGLVVAPPGQFLAEELEARDWTIQEFAQVIDRPFQVVSDIVNARRKITPATAREIGAGLGTSAQMWLGLQQDYDLWLAEQEASNEEQLREIAHRSHLHTRVAVRELENRGILSRGLPVAVAERRIGDLLGVTSLDEDLPVAASRADERSGYGPKQLAWVAAARARHGRVLDRSFDRDRLELLAGSLAQSGNDPRVLLSELPRRFAECGVVLGYEPHVPGANFAGVSFYMGGTPVIVVSGQRARNDMVVFTILHEAAHILNDDISPEGGFLIDDVDLGDGSRKERRANQRAGEWILTDWQPPPKPYSKAKVLAAAERQGVHPSFIVGRLQKQHGLKWSHLNGLCVKNVRPELEAWTVFT